jgi:hypothetical protein
VFRYLPHRLAEISGARVERGDGRPYEEGVYADQELGPEQESGAHMQTRDAIRREGRLRQRSQHRVSLIGVRGGNR